MKRHITQIISGDISYDGAGVKLRRVLNNKTVYDFDPFLMLDGFDSKNPLDYTKGFPWHPHRGIETITYLIKGDIEHADSLGNSGSIKDGQCQWMTAGSGIIHQEMPQEVEKMLGVQLWLNLPAKNKMTSPKYNDIKAEQVPVIEENGVTVRVIAGNYKATKGAFEGAFVKMTYLDVSLTEGRKWGFETEPEATLFFYVALGSLKGKNSENVIVPIKKNEAALFSIGKNFEIEATENSRILVAMAKPLKEPVVWGGPIVMNTKEELNLAFQEIKENTFLKTDNKSGF